MNRVRAWLAGFDRCVFGNHMMATRSHHGLCRKHAPRGDDIIERVNRGVELLNEARPGWYNDIDLDALRIDNNCMCVVGQTFLTDATGWGGTWRPGAPDPAQVYDAAYGFDYTSDDELPALQRAWVNAIRKLRDQ